jgi:hypothetical protein
MTPFNPWVSSLPLTHSLFKLKASSILERAGIIVAASKRGKVERIDIHVGRTMPKILVTRAAVFREITRHLLQTAPLQTSGIFQPVRRSSTLFPCTVEISFLPAESRCWEDFLGFTNYFIPHRQGDIVRPNETDVAPYSLAIFHTKSTSISGRRAYRWSITGGLPCRNVRQ